jgi:GDP/UDP-N,N'-diacetylbacillosamine 2-epimerase (hydrolysing)
MSQTEELLKACENASDMKFIFTEANADKDGQIINSLLAKYVETHRESSVCVASLGAYYYLSAMKYCEFVLGNSSSGLIEAPSFGIPTINIGDRQKGRERAESIIDCEPEADSICRAICKARSYTFREKCKEVKNPNGDGKTSERILSKIKEIYYSNGFSMEKKFYDAD